jgi:hypothetical protein
MANTQEYGGGTSTRLPPPPRPPRGTYDLSQNPPPQPVQPNVPSVGNAQSPQWQNIPGIPAGVVPAQPPFDPQVGSGFGGEAPPPSPKEVREKRVAEDKNRREFRDDVLFDTSPGQQGVYQITDREYNRLSDDQKRAIDFNTMLVGVTRKDRRNQETYKPNPQQKANYAAALDQVFGTDHANYTTYAPETVEFLQQAGIRDSDAELSDYLTRRTAITTDDLQVIDPSSGVLPVTTQAASGQGAPLLRALSTAALGPWGAQLAIKRQEVGLTARLEQSLAHGKSLLAGIAPSITSAAAVARNPARYGGINTTMTALGYAPPTTSGQMDLNSYYLQAFEKMAETTTPQDRDQLLGLIRTGLGDPKQFDDFMRYARARAANAGTYGEPLGNLQGGTYATPEQFDDLWYGTGKGLPTPPKRAKQAPAQPPPAPPAKQEVTY